jgi:hypothetical protein
VLAKFGRLSCAKQAIFGRYNGMEDHPGSMLSKIAAVKNMLDQVVHY